jgi:uncharacterized protein YebE (UPF0316 family)
MFSEEFLQSNLFNWVLFPLMIFLARTSDVTLATLRNIFLSKNFRHVVPFMGFVEVLIWLMAVTQIVRNLSNWVGYIAFAAGYSMGIFVGIKIEERLALGMQAIRIITHLDSTSLIHSLKEKSFGVTTMDAQGAQGPVKIVFVVVKRKSLPEVQRLIASHNPRAFYSIEDIRTASQGVFPQAGSPGKSRYFQKLFPMMKF